MFVLFTTAKVSKIFEKLTAFCLPIFLQLLGEEAYRDSSLPFDYYHLDSLGVQLESLDTSISQIRLNYFFCVSPNHR